VHDAIFLRHNGKIYSNEFPYAILKRYVNLFSRVTVLARVEDRDEVGDIPLSCGEGVEFVFLESISTLRSFFGLRQRHKALMRKLISRHSGVIVRLPSELGLMAANTAEEIGAKYLVEVVGCGRDIMWHYGGLKAKVYAPFLFLKMRHSIRNAAYVMYVTDSFLQKRYPASKRAKTIGVSDVEIADFEEGVLSQRIKKIGSGGARIVFGTIASLRMQYKGIETALRMLAVLSKRYEMIEYRILGEGDPAAYRNIAAELGILDKVFFDGTLPRGKAVGHWLDGIDIYLQPSFIEGLPRSVIEAMSRGCPVVASSVGGIPELVESKMLFSLGDINEFVDKVESLMNDKKLMLQTAEKNFYTSKQYRKNTLEKRRNAFLKQFREELR
jgi:glycosyltransferase involved in cell wall biosynthesis